MQTKSPYMKTKRQLFIEHNHLFSSFIQAQWDLIQCT